jgi:23S rRNA pseudouridine1911/1915/1917 synthase
MWQVETPARLEIFLRQCLPNASRESLRRVLAAGACRVDGVVRPTGFRLTVGALVELDADARVSEVIPQTIPLEILYEDDDLLAIHKPAGMLVHPTTHERTGTVGNALRGAGYGDIHLLHRLDRATSGVLLAAKRLAAHSPLASMFAAREVEKRYLAVVAGPVGWEECVISHPIGRDPARKPQWGVQADGAPAETRLRLLRRDGGVALLEAVPVTGRTNQIRIHCAAEGHPLLGDTVYGGPPAARLFLHAWSLEIPMLDGGRLRIVAPAPAEFPGLRIPSGTG